MKFTPMKMTPGDRKAFSELIEMGIGCAICVVGALVAAGIAAGVIPDTVGIAIGVIFGAFLAIGILCILIILLGGLLMELGKALYTIGDFLVNVFCGNYRNWKSLRYYRELYKEGFEAFVRKNDPLLASHIDWDVYR